MMSDTGAFDVQAVDREPPPPPPDVPAVDGGTCVDMDNDGHPSAACGGDDCDDNNPRRNPSVREVCDNLGADEDCNPCTVAEVTPTGRGGDGDTDGDGFPKDACFNVLSAGAPAPVCDSAVVDDGGVRALRVVVAGGRVSGTDCADNIAEGGSTRFPGATEVCNLLDDDCDGTPDDGVQFTRCFVDADRDRFAPMGAAMMTMNVCAMCPAGYTPMAPEGINVDCDDTNSARYPGNVENCDGADNDCNAMTDDGANDSRVGRACAVSTGVGQCGVGTSACTSGAIQCRANTALPELCNGLDDDCDGSTDEPACTDSHTAPTGMGFCGGSGECVMTECNRGRGNCDGSNRNGCEADFSTDANNCGGCGVRCWAGACVAGRCVDGASPEISAGSGHTCARFAGNVVCWGTNVFGQLGDGRSGSTENTPVRVVGVSDAAGLAAASAFTCARRTSGQVSCWGRGTEGQLGTGSMIGVSVAPVAVMGVSDAVQLSATALHACVVRMGGGVQCWGNNAEGQIGDGMIGGNRLAPVAVTGLTDAVEVSAGNSHTCARRTSGQVVCWGANASGQLGSGAVGTSRAAPVAVGGLTDAVEIAAGATHTCARRMTGAVVCWGSNGAGELGDGTTGVDRPAPVAVMGLTDAVEISAGAGFTCARRATGQIVCWGDNGTGMLGTGGASAAVPAVVVGIADAVEIEAGSSHMCARRSNGRVLCWGTGTTGQLGDGFRVNRTTPMGVIGISDPVELSAGMRHTCARLASGRVSCWGFAAAVGDGSNMPVFRPFPSTVVGLTDVTRVSAGGGESPLGSLNNSTLHACANTQTRGVSCWGSNSTGQLGNGSMGAASLTPVAVSSLSDSIEVSAGGGPRSVGGISGPFTGHSCAVRSTGEVVCWGANPVGQLGNGTTTGSTTPVQVTGISDAVEVSTGAQHSCARRRSGAVVCWGGGEQGVLGDGGVRGVGGFSATPVTVFGLSDAVEVSAGAFHACARRLSGRVVCWGWNQQGQVGSGATGPSFNAPVEVVGLTDAVEISCGGLHSCARRASGAIVCWGANDSGGLGNGSTTLSATPVAVTGITDALEIDVGGAHTCARRPLGVWCWGRNFAGELGDGTTGMMALMPVQVRGL
ncbi:MAG: hypothetical protein JNK05_39205 [Myxococcales bacterium]|nr:hypothetical protein [Myxococcales bacterium]